MTIPRKQQISLSDTPYYHVTSRCVRRAFLCGFDPLNQKSYEHRRQWIEDRIRLLSSLFAIELCAFSLMQNHFHLVLLVTPEQSESWSAHDVIKRWLSMFKGPLLIRQFHEGVSLSKAEQSTVNDIVEVWRDRLTNISWFMKCLNEPIARQANKEDNCTGHFWESRFHCQPLLTDEALLSCMSYVDLNPVRAGIAPTPEASEYTSIKERLKPRFDLSQAIKSFVEHGGCGDYLKGRDAIPLKPLAAFTGGNSIGKHDGIHFELKDYLELVDFTGRAIRDDKHGHINDNLAPILQRLKATEEDWLENSQHFESLYYSRFAKRRRKKEAA